MSLFQPSRGTAGSTAAVPQQPSRTSAIGYEAVRASRDFWTIQRRYGPFVRPVCTLFVAWHFLPDHLLFRRIRHHARKEAVVPDTRLRGACLNAWACR